MAAAGDPTTLAVRGEASVEVLADQAVVSVHLQREDPDRELAAAGAGELARAVRSVVADATGVRRSTISRLHVTEVSTWDEQRHANVRAGWQATLGGTVVADAAAVGALAGDLVAVGAQILGVDWRVDDDNPAHREVRRLAVADAERAAADFAAALGGTVGRLLELADSGLMSSVPQAVSLGMVSPGMALVRGGTGAVEVDAQLLQLRAVVEARYLLAPG